MADKHLTDFMEMTGTKDRGIADFYVSSAGGDVNKAVDLYYESVKGSRIKTLQDKPQTTNTFFAGGDKSGVLLQGRPDKAEGSDIVKDILSLASQSKPFDDDHQEEEESKYKGTGYSLSGNLSNQSSSKDPERNQDDVASRLLTFWKNGFSIDDGPLRDFNDPENEAFLNSIKNGMAPLQYLNLKPGQKVELKIAHKSDQDFEPPPKAPMKAFSGAGQRLGSIVPGSSASSSVQNSQVQSENQSIKFQINENEPVTSIQIRLGDGTRLVLKCNHSHKIGDIRNFILASRPGESSRMWILQTAHPVKVLDNLNQTIKEAGLLNSVVIQRYS